MTDDRIMSTTADEAQHSSDLAEYSGELLPHELFWRDNQKWLEERGYMLRPRYRLGWRPSWEGQDTYYWRCEDGIRLSFAQIMDAIRISDGTMVALKNISINEHPLEVELSQFFSTEPLASDPRNHCIPVHEVLRVPNSDNVVLLVMPLLRIYNDPEFETVGEVIDFFRQMFEGLQFMHEHHVAHRDCMNFNIMMDPGPLFPCMYHPQRRYRSLDLRSRAKHYTRTSCPTKYYLIDFGLSRKYDPHGGPPLDYPVWGGDRTVPEFYASRGLYNPFPTDVYYLGNLMREDFLQIYRGLDFMRPLMEDMVHRDPAQRPNMEQVVNRFGVITGTLGIWKLRSRLVKIDEFWMIRLYKIIRHAIRTIRYILTFRPAIPVR